MTKNKQVKITDFGISKKIEKNDSQIMLTRGVGTKYYRSPEMIAEQDYDYKTDVW